MRFSHLHLVIQSQIGVKKERNFEKLTKKNLKFSATTSNRGSGSPGGSSSGYYTPPSVGGLEAAEASNSKKGSSPESSQRNSVSSESEDPGCSDSEDQTSAPSLTSTRCLKRLCVLRGCFIRVFFLKQSRCKLLNPRV